MSSTNQKLVSGSVDGMILCYDMESKELDDAWFDDDEAGIRQIHFSPFLPFTFMSVAENGKIITRDLRLSTSDKIAQAIQRPCEVTGIDYHPLAEHLFLSSEVRGTMALWDSRNVSSPVKSWNIHPNIGQVTDVSFDDTGARFGAVVLSSDPRIYAIDNEEPVAVLQGCRNYCTIKHGSFMGNLFSTGSDDFSSYLWKIPNPTPVYQLTGHVSIVNSSVIHPYLPHIFTAGIEKDIVLHSTTPTSLFGELELTNREPRELNDFADVDEDERETVMFFDSIIQVETPDDTKDLEDDSSDDEEYD